MVHRRGRRECQNRGVFGLRTRNKWRHGQMESMAGFSAKFRSRKSRKGELTAVGWCIAGGGGNAKIGEFLACGQGTNGATDKWRARLDSAQNLGPENRGKES